MGEAAGGVGEASWRRWQLEVQQARFLDLTLYLKNHFLVVQSPPPTTDWHSLLQPRDTAHQSKKGLGFSLVSCQLLFPFQGKLLFSLQNQLSSYILGKPLPHELGTISAGFSDSHTSLATISL